MERNKAPSHSTVVELLRCVCARLARQLASQTSCFDCQLLAVLLRSQSAAKKADNLGHVRRARRASTIVFWASHSNLNNQGAANLTPGRGKETVTIDNRTF